MEETPDLTSDVIVLIIVMMMMMMMVLMHMGIMEASAS